MAHFKTSGVVSWVSLIIWVFSASIAWIEVLALVAAFRLILVLGVINSWFGSKLSTVATTSSLHSFFTSGLLFWRSVTHLHKLHFSTTLPNWQTSCRHRHLQGHHSVLVAQSQRITVHHILNISHKDAENDAQSAQLKNTSSKFKHAHA